MSSEKTITFKTLEPLLKLHIQCNQVPFLAGDPGIGKSAVLKKLAHDLNTQAFVLSVNQLGTREDLTGARSIMDEKTKTYRQVFFPHAIIQDCIDYANNHPKETPLLFLDEVNRTSTDVTSAIMAIITERRVGTTILPSNIRIVAAGNDEGNINVMDDASNSRMQIYHIKPDIDSFMNAQSDLNYYIKKVLTKNPKLLVQIPTNDNLMDPDASDNDDNDDTDSNVNLDDLFDDNGMKQITVPRTLTYLSDFLNAAGFDGRSIPADADTLYNQLEPDESPLFAAITATIGETETASTLFDTIVDSINTLTITPTTSVPTINIPTPKQEIVDAMQNDINSDDDVNEMFADTNLTSNNFVDTFFTLVQLENYKKLKYRESINQYYRNLTTLSLDNTAQIKFSQTFAELLRYNLIPTPMIDAIKKEHDGLSSRLGVLIDTLS